MSKYANKVIEKGRSRARDTFEVDSSLLKGEWVRCPKCYEELRSDNLERHLGKVHHVKMVQMDRGKNELFPVIGLVIVVMLVLGGIGIYFIVTGNKGDDGGEVDIPDEGWLDTYSPKEKVGSSDDDWWTVYPHQNPNNGDMPSHPSWITEKLKSGPVLVFAHSDNCVPCIQQQESVNAIMKNYGNDIQLLDYLSGVDARASEVFGVYDPNGSPNYIPLTIIITIVEDSFGVERIGWHGTEGATKGEWLTNYVKDAIYYHHQNIDEWG